MRLIKIIICLLLVGALQVGCVNEPNVEQSVIDTDSASTAATSESLDHTDNKLAPQGTTIETVPPSTVHVHEYAATVIEPTCVEQGYTRYTCECGDTYDGDMTDVIEHNYEQVIYAPTCTSDGYTENVCKDCGNNYISTITEAIGHDYETEITYPTCCEEGYTSYLCVLCGYSYIDSVTDALGHDWGDWIVVEDATTSREGEKYRECNTCYEKQTRTIEKKSIARGRSITLNYQPTSADCMVYPREDDFSVFYNQAVTLYNAIVEKQEVCYLYFHDQPFTDESYKKEWNAWVEFKALFEEKVLCDNAAIVMENFSTGVFEDIPGSTKIKILPCETCSLNEQCYNANIAAGLYNGMSELDAVTKINRWICNNVDYASGYSDAQDALTEGKAKCAGYAKLFYYMCANAGIDCKYVTGCTEYSDNDSSPCPACHAWNQVKIGDTWYYIDTCWNDTSSNSYFLSEELWGSRSVYSTTRMW